MRSFEEIGIEERIEFEESESIEEVKDTLKIGVGVIITEDKCKAIYYSEDQGKLYLLQHIEDIRTVQNCELEAEEIQLEQADKLIAEYLEALNKERDRRKKYDDWLSK